jgi:hypothetical protein
MSSSNKFNSILFNLSGVGVLLTVAGYAIYSYVTTPEVVRCTARYPSGQQLALNGLHGIPLSPGELQGRSGSREWGLLKNAKITNNHGGHAGSVMEVTLASTDNEEKIHQNGVGYVWPLSEITKVQSACLSYSVLVPASFAFKEYGWLPGLFGAADANQIDEPLHPEDAFAARMGWASQGEVGVDLRSPAGNYWNGGDRVHKWPTGKWVGIEQEVQLNAPGQENGELRVWIDGKLTLNKSNLVFRKTAGQGLTGVIADVAYATTPSDVATVLLSPFMVQWQ